MNPWPFVIGAYAATLAGVGWLALSSWAEMRAAEREARSLGRDREA